MFGNLTLQAAWNPTLRWCATVAVWGVQCAVAFVLGIRDPITENFLVVAFLLGATISTFYAKTGERLYGFYQLGKGWTWTTRRDRETFAFLCNVMAIGLWSVLIGHLLREAWLIWR
jgi:hypothetical protein